MPLRLRRRRVRSGSASLVAVLFVAACSAPGSEAPGASGSDEPLTTAAEYRACVAEAVADGELAEVIGLENGTLAVGPGVDLNALPSDDAEALFHCADRAAPGLSVPIDVAAARRATGDEAVTGGNTPGLEAPRLTGNRGEFAECMRKAGRENLGQAITLTPGGLPDFTTIDFALSAEQFQFVVDCVPGLGSQISPTSLPADIRARAQSVADQARQSVVYITVAKGGGTGIGTGFLISHDGLVLTNQHVVAEGASFTVWLLDGRRFEAALLGSTIHPDIALLRIKSPTGISPLPIGAAADLEEGDTMVAIGHPSGAGNWVATAGAFLRFRTAISIDVATGISGERTDLDSTVPTFSGNSGSPLLDLDGRVVGVVYGGDYDRPVDPGQRDPKVASSAVHEFAVPTTVTNAVPIEHALRLAADFTGDRSLAPATASEFAERELPTVLSPKASVCVADAIGDLAASFRLTSAGMPDFSQMGTRTLSPAQFSALIDCLPGISFIASPVLLAEATLEPAFSKEVRSQAQAIGERARESVVYLELGEGAIATGFLISDDGLILTNRHNVTNATDPAAIRARFIDGRSYEARVVGVATELDPDVALLQIDAPPDVSPLALGASRGLSRDQPLIAVGHPAAMGNWVVTLGSFLETRPHTLDRQGNTVTDLVTTTPILSGNSGSPVLDLQGRVVGIMYSGAFREPGGMATSPPPASPEVREFLNVAELDAAAAVRIEDALELMEGWTAAE